MDQLVLEVGPDTTIHIQQIGGDLRLTGWDQNQFFAEAEDDGSLKLDRSGEPLTLVASSDATVRVPRGAQVIIETVGGDAQIKGLEGRLHVRTVGGDLRLRQTADTNIERVGGDISAKKVTGYLRVATVGGDLFAQRVGGDFAVTRVGGDLSLRDVEGSIQAAGGGDVAVHVAFKPGQSYNVQAGADLSVRTGLDTTARFDVRAGADLTIDIPNAQIEGNGRHKIVTLGTGDPTVMLVAGGDLTLSGQAGGAEGFDEFGDRFGEDFGVMADEFAAQIENQIESQIESQMADFERVLSEKLGGLEMGTLHLRAEEVAAKARRAAERQAEHAKRRMERQSEAAQRRVEAAQRHAEREAERARRQAEAAQRRADAIARRAAERQTGRAGNWTFFSGPRPPTPPTPPIPPVPPTPPASPVSDEERMVILRMVEQGKISVADAEKLLAALEGN